MELCWLTCVSSELNGAELCRAGGVPVLGALAQRCATVLPRDALPHAPGARDPDALPAHVCRHGRLRRRARAARAAVRATLGVQSY